MTSKETLERKKQMEITKVDWLIDAYDNSKDKDPEWSGSAWDLYRDRKAKIEKDLEELEELKGVEKELGIDLITLFSALKNGIYVMRKDTKEIKKAYIYSFSFNRLWKKREFEAYSSIVYRFNWRDDLFTEEEKYLKDFRSHPLVDKIYTTGFGQTYTLKTEEYGKFNFLGFAWALTKEELEK